VLRAVLSSVTAPPRTAPPEIAPTGPVPAGPRRLRMEAPWRRRVDWWRLAPVLAALLFSIVYLIWEPRTVDMAAHTYRAELFGREGFTIWNGAWYGGHHTPAYSVLSPPLAWLVGPPMALVIAAVSSAALFEPLARRHFGAERARYGALWFGIATATLLFTSRLPFAIGVAFGLASALALQRQRRVLAPVLAALSSLGSPVAGIFLMMAGVAYGIAAQRPERRRKRTDGLILAAASLLPPVFLTVAFPEGGWAPFPTNSYVPIPLFAIACLMVLPRRERTLRVAAVLYALGATVALLIASPMGGNAVRLGALLGGPVLLCGVWGERWHRLMYLPFGALVAALAIWQWSPAVRDLAKAIDDPAARADYFKPLAQYLETLPDQRRIEIPFTQSHWESAEIAPIAPLARGWLRQLDTEHNPIFYTGDLTPLTYASWLTENAVRYVALPSVKPDSSSYQERALIERGLPYLKLRWRSKDWRVYEVMLPSPFVISKGRANMQLEQLGNDRVLLRVIRPGQALVRVRWTQYWLAHGGCVQPDQGWTLVTARHPGYLLVDIRFSLERIFERGRRCNWGGG
jgi:hypothetical protein